MTEDPLNWLTIQFDSQLLSAFMSCPREFDYKYIRHLIPVTGVKPAFEEGSLMHFGMQCYYNALKDGYNVLEARAIGLAGAKKFALTLNNIKPEATVEVYHGLEEYFVKWQNDNFNILAVEQTFKLVAYEVYPLRIVLTGKIDLIVRLLSGLVVPIDHKKERMSRFYSATSNQFKIYCIATDTTTLIINKFGMQSSYKPDKKFTREDICFDRAVLEEFKQEVLPYYAKQLIDVMNEGYYAPNYASCIGGQFACEFSDKADHKGICTVDPLYREEKLMKYYKVGKEWSPENE